MQSLHHSVGVQQRTVSCLVRRNQIQGLASALLLPYQTHRPLGHIVAGK